MRKPLSLRFLPLLLTLAMLPGLVSCVTETFASDDLMAGIAPNTVSEKNADDIFQSNQMRLALALMQGMALEENTLISPLSIQLALAMTANGADGATREEMQAVLGGDIPLATLNEQLYSYVKGLPSDEKYKVGIHNAIWFREGLTVKEPFLQINADYYGAAAYQAPFDAGTVEDINGWIKEKTDGMIERVVGEISDDSRMFLVNTLLFDAEWQTKYEMDQMKNEIFTALDGIERDVTMMHSIEHTYLSLPNATGFLKNYAGGNYAFMALLPNEGVSLDAMLASLTPDSLLSALENPLTEAVSVALPQFTAEYGSELKGFLAGLGMPTAFDSLNADFSGMTDDERLYIGSVLHKTKIEVSPVGTRAGAATVVEMKCESAIMPPEPEKEVILDRPFLYMILDTETNLPLFIGALTDIAS